MRQRQPIIVGMLLVLVTHAMIATMSIAADWPQWRGAEGTGISSEKQPPIVWHEQRSIVWKTAMPGPAASTPAIWGEAVFVTAHTSDDKLLLLRLNKKTGEVVWTQEVGSGTKER